MSARTILLLLLAHLPLLGSCAAPTYLLDEDEMKAFLAAGPVLPEVDREALMRSITPPSRYELCTGDLLEIRGPRALFVTATAAQVGGTAEQVHLTRVDEEGNVEVPLAGTLQARGRSILELEQAVTDAVHPRFLVTKPAIVVKVSEYNRLPVTVIGAVETPGIHELRSDRLTLFGALSEAGGILKSTNLVVGARKIRVRKPGQSTTADIVLPVKGLNIPFSDVKLAGGETIEVERYEPDTFTVIGLVERPGAYEYPPEVTYNLMQALAVAGGVDTIADPPYATIFRKDPTTGRIIPATFEIKGTGVALSSALPIKPGDVIAVEHTALSWTRSLLAQVLQLQFNFFTDPFDARY